MGRQCGARRRRQLFQQGMADQRQPRLGPQGAVGDKQRVPVALAQRSQQRLGRLQHGTVFIEQGQGVAQWPPHRADAGAADFGGLQAVEVSLDRRLLQPDQAVEKVVQVVACRHLAGAVNEGLVGLAGRQIGLRHKTGRQGCSQRRGCGLRCERQRLVQGPCHRARQRSGLLPAAQCTVQRWPQRRQPRRIQLQQQRATCRHRGQRHRACHPLATAQTTRAQSCWRQARVSPLHSGLSRASPNGSDSGSTQGWRSSVTVPVLRGRP